MATVTAISTTPAAISFQGIGCGALYVPKGSYAPAAEMLSGS